MRKLLRFSLAFGAGTALCVYLPLGSWLWPAAGALLLLSVLLRVPLGRRRLLGVAAGFTAALLWFSVYNALYVTPCDAMTGRKEAVTVELFDYPEETDYGTRCTVRVLTPKIRGKVVCYGGRELMELVPGNRVTAKGKFSSVGHGRKASWYTSQGIFLKLSLDRRSGAWDSEGTDGTLENTPLHIDSGRAGELRYLPQRLAHKTKNAALSTYSQSTAGLVVSMLTGSKIALSPESLRDLRGSGLIHITAVSGLHCGFLIALIGLLVLRRQRLTAIIGYPVLLLYVLMTGAAPSSIRAAIMAGMFILAPLIGREGDAPTSLGAAMLVILVMNPYSVASISFQLSFASVAGLLYLSPRIWNAIPSRHPSKWKGLNKLNYFFKASLSSSLSVLVCTAPLSVVYFGYLPLISPISNLLALWCAPLLFGAAFLVTGLVMVCPALSFLSILAELPARYILAVAHITAAVPKQGITFNTTILWLWLLWSYLLLTVCLLSRERNRKYAVAAVLSLAGLFAARSLPKKVVADDRLTAIAVDVGQGASALLMSGEKAGLVDCGSLYRPAGERAADVLHTMGRDRLSWVALTHYHEDHAGGLRELLALVPVDRLILPQLENCRSQSPLQTEITELAASYHIPVTYVDKVITEPMGDSTVTFYPPLSQGETNEEGLTVLGTAGDFDLLITGDMSSATERKLIAAYDLPDIEVLFLGHHGSRHATSEDFIKALRPEVGIISAGENNFGHPSMETMERCAFWNMTLYRTDMQGSILIRVPPERDREE